LSAPRNLENSSVQMNVGEGSESPVYLRKNPAVWRIDFDNGNSDFLESMLNKVPGIQAFKASFKDMLVKDNIFRLMVCDSVNITYGAGTWWTTYKDGFPNKVSMEISFSQMFPWQTAEDLFGKEAINELFPKLNGLFGTVAGQLGF